MSDLQISLLAIGAAVVVAIYGFNQWQERKLRRKLNESFARPQADVFVEEVGEPRIVSRIEPSMGQPAPVAIEETAAGVAEAYAAEQPDFEEPPLHLVVPAYLEQEYLDRTPQPLDLDPAIEYIARLHPGEPIPAQAMNEVVQQLNTLGKAVRWRGLNQMSGSWEPVAVQGDASYLELAVAIQLADRNGPLSDTQLGEFCAAVQAFASRQLAVVDFPDKQAALRLAQELDQFCLDVDVLIGLNVVAPNDARFAADKIVALAEGAGMQLKPEGVFHYCDAQGTSLYTLCNHESSPFTADRLASLSTHGVTLLFDVPRVPNGLETFDRMTALGRKLANSLGGMLVDDNIRPLSDSGLDKIRQQLSNIYRKMDARQIGAGSARALRLFS